MLNLRVATRWAGLWSVAALLLCAGCVAPRQQVQLHLDSGDAALAKHDLEAALAEFRAAVRLDPTFSAAHSKLGLALKASGELSAAAEALKAAVRLDPGDFLSTFELAEVYRLLNRVTQAIRAYVIACELNPLSFEARVELAGCYHRIGELDQAADAYEAALRIDPKNALAWSNLGAIQHRMGEPYKAIQAYKRSLECGPPQPAVLVNLATVYLHQQRWQTARNTLRAALEVDPGFSPAHERLGYCLWRQGLYAAAGEQYAQAIQLDGRNAAARAGYGVVRMTQYLDEPEKRSYRDEAIESWHVSLELDANQPKLRALIEKYQPRQEQPALLYEE